ncbi:MAG: hypothetical protein ACREUX_16095, partial [Burkholderiales bacterium]
LLVQRKALRLPAPEIPDLPGIGPFALRAVSPSLTRAGAPDTVGVRSASDSSAPSLHPGADSSARQRAVAAAPVIDWSAGYGHSEDGKKPGGKPWTYSAGNGFEQLRTDGNPNAKIRIPVASPVVHDTSVRSGIGARV